MSGISVAVAVGMPGPNSFTADMEIISFSPGFRKKGACASCAYDAVQEVEAGPNSHTSSRLCSLIFNWNCSTDF